MSNPCDKFRIVSYRCTQIVTSKKRKIVVKNLIPSNEEKNEAREKVIDEMVKNWVNFGFTRSDAQASYYSAEVIPPIKSPIPDPEPVRGNCKPSSNECALGKPATVPANAYRTLVSIKPVINPITSYRDLNSSNNQPRKIYFDTNQIDFSRIKRLAKNEIDRLDRIINDNTGREPLDALTTPSSCKVCSQYSYTERRCVGTTTYYVNRPDCIDLIKDIKEAAKRRKNRIQNALNAYNFKIVASILKITPFKSGGSKRSATIKVAMSEETKTIFMDETYETRYRCERNDPEPCCDCSSSSSSSSSSSTNYTPPCDSYPYDNGYAVVNCIQQVQNNNIECCQNWTSQCDQLYCNCVEAQGITGEPRCSSSSSSSSSSLASTELNFDLLNILD